MIHFCALGTIKRVTNTLVCMLGVFSSLNAFSQPLLSVVTTTSIIADTTKRIGGEKIDVRSLMGAGIDPHLYKASPGDLRLLSGADLVLHNGLHLEGKLTDALEKLSARKPVVSVTARIPVDRLRRTSDFQGYYDPHVWFDVSLWLTVAEHIRDLLIEHDRAHETHYLTQFRTLQSELEELHAWCTDELRKIPAPRRLLVSAHDAFGYFGRAYGLEVRGIQGLSTDSEASLQDIHHLVELLVQRDIPAVFVENSVSPKTVEALVEGARSRGHALSIGGELFSDTLGPPDSAAGSYIGMIRHNVVTITSALTPSGPHVSDSN